MQYLVSCAVLCGMESARIRDISSSATGRANRPWGRGWFVRAGFCCTSVSRTAASSGELTGFSSASSGSGTAVGGGSAGASAVSIGSPSAIRSYAARKSVSSSKSEAWVRISSVSEESKCSSSIFRTKSRGREFCVSSW